MNSVELQDKKNQLKKEAVEMTEICKKEIREFSEEEKEKFENLKAEIEKINEELKKLEESLNSDNSENNDKENKEEKTETMERNFSLIGAIRSIANNKNLDEIQSAVVEKGAEEMRKSGISYNGQIQLPTSELRSDITVTSEGEDVVATDLYDILEPLRAKNILVSAGAKFLTNLVGDVQVPSMGAGNCTWEGETASASDAGYTFSNVKLSPKRLTAYVDLSKQFLAQDSKSAEMLIRQDLINAINSKLESTILGTESGSATQPAGIFAEATGATAVSDFKGVCELESEVEDANVMGECKYIMSNKAKAAFRNMPKSTKSTQLVMEAGTIDGTPVLNTSNVAEKYVAYGDFSNLAIGQWGAIDLVVDPYSLAKEAKIRLVVNAYFDAKVLNANAIKCTKVA